MEEFQESYELFLSELEQFCYFVLKGISDFALTAVQIPLMPNIMSLCPSTGGDRTASTSLYSYP